MRKVEAVYEGGVLRPVEKLPLEEHQLVTLVVLSSESDENADFELPESFEGLADHRVTRDMVRRALSSIPGSLDSDFAAERNER